MNIAVYYRSFFDRRFFIPRCLLCQRAGHYGLPLCDGCHGDQPWLTHACPLCAEPLPADAPGRAVCGRCLTRPPPVTRTLSALRYEFPLDHLTHRLKDHADLPSLKLAARLFSDRFADAIADRPPQLLIPVPLHPTRLYQRGYNQASELAYWIGRQLGIPVRDDLVQRTQPTPHQQGLSAKQRRLNLRHAFVARWPTDVQRVAIVDDVITTGATTRAIADALLKAGPRKERLEIEAWSIARTPRQRATSGR